MKKNLINLVYIGISVFVAGIISYMYHPIMLNFLSIEEFSELGSIIGIFNILSVLVSAIGLFIVKEISQDKQDRKLATIVNFGKKELFLLGLSLYLLFVLLTPFLSKFLKIDNYIIFVLIGTTIVFSFIGIVYGAFFQAKERFKTLAIFNIAGPIVKLIFGTGLVFLGFGIYGAVGGLMLSQIIILSLNIYIVVKYLKNKDRTSFHKKEFINDLKSDKTQIINYFLASFILALLMNADILFAKHFFDEIIAGTYAGISILAKFVIFIAMSIETVYYPIIVKEKTINKKKILLVSSIYIFLGFISLLGVYFVGEYLLNILKKGFGNYLDLLYLIVIYCNLLALLNFLVKIFIAFKKYKINYLSYIFSLLLVASLFFFVKNNIYNLVIIFDIFTSFLVFFSFIYLWKIND